MKKSTTSSCLLVREVNLLMNDVARRAAAGGQPDAEGHDHNSNDRCDGEREMIGFVPKRPSVAMRLSSAGQARMLTIKTSIFLHEHFNTSNKQIDKLIRNDLICSSWIHGIVPNPWTLFLLDKRDSR